jgi:putative molybdopterin biosynthesis protein
MESYTLLSTKEVAEYLKINEKMIYTLIAEKGLPASKVTGKWLFSKHLVDQWVELRTSNLPAQSSKKPFGQELLILTGSNDILLERLLAAYNQKYPDQCAVFGNIGSMGGIRALKGHRCDIATSHLMQEDEQEYNFAFIGIEFDPPPAVVNFCRRQQGILLAPGNPKNIEGVADLAKPGVTIVNRALGTGTRLLLDKALAKHSILGEQITGYNTILYSHLDVGLEILAAKADAGFGIQPVAAMLGLDFLPLRWERYDFLISKERFFAKEIQQFLGMLSEPAFRKMADDLTGYDISTSGRMIYPQEKLSPPTPGPQD